MELEQSRGGGKSARSWAAAVQCSDGRCAVQDLGLGNEGLFFLFLSLSLSLRKGRHSAAGNQNLHLRPPFPRVSSVPLSVECKNIHAERARVFRHCEQGGTKDTFSSYAK